MNAENKNTRPNHVAIIMDGNGRWAEKRGLPRIAGHRAGVKALRKLIEFAVEINLNVITVYAFSRENWQRPEREVSLLMDLFMSSLQSEVQDLHKNNVKLKFIGEKSSFSKKLQESINNAEALTSSNTGLCLNVAVNYSGRWDILQACRSLINKTSTNPDLKDINEEDINKNLSLVDFNEPDLFIRTGGEQRISNYLLWQLAYTELYFTDILWPDFDADQFKLAIEWFEGRQRRFGKTSEQVKKVVQ
ncbi:MAG: polyprenyl diphosphate synthase [Proteobacteria bacterium]|nr:polyprenyl diphosphate synthase [Pseudomonadota bacterium]